MRNGIQKVAMRKLKVEWLNLETGMDENIYVHFVRDPRFVSNNVLIPGAPLYPLQSHTLSPIVNAQQ